MDRSVDALRKEYSRQQLTEAEVDRDPCTQFRLWFEQAVTAGLPEPNAMTLATIAADGRPAARMMLLKGLDHRGFVFYTNYESRKGGELSRTPWAALVFWWCELERQVRIEGQVEKVSEQESDLYFRSRPLGSQLAACASRQSELLSSRADLEQRIQALASRYADEEVPRPRHWGGYRVVPTAIEFWQGRPSRVHDRLRYRLAGGNWVLERLSP